MGIGYMLVNFTRKEVVKYTHLPTSKARELAGSPVSAAITTWYLLEHPGEQIAFVSDSEDDWPFPLGSRKDVADYQEMTNAVVQQLITEGILRDDGVAWADEEEPKSVHVRALKNVWMQ
ncbi:MAG: hypothetical protein QM703_27825 [Gemmatales bacterium]